MLDDFLADSLLLDLESQGDRILQIGAIYAGESLFLKGRFALDQALAELERLAEGASRLLGHNLLGHDLPLLERFGGAAFRFQALPVIDTLYLSPLAFPTRPYHRLVKNYKLQRQAVNDPLADARLAARLFGDQWQRLSELNKDALAFYAFCFAGPSTCGDRQGLSHVLTHLAGREAMSWASAVAYLGEKFADQTCRHTLRRQALQGLTDRQRRPAWAYVAAWLEASATSSVLPPWVRHRFPACVPLTTALREVPCDDRQCAYCRRAHDPEILLHRYFGFDSFRVEPATVAGESLQRAVVCRVLAGQPVLAVLATGAGKSLCYQLPALVRHFRRGLLTIVVSPLQALMKDQVDQLNTRTGTACATALYGLLTPLERGAVLEGVRQGEIALLYVAPEQLRNRSFLRAIEQREIAGWVFDEAHCLSKWGHDFRPDYLYASRFIKQLAARQGVAPPPVFAFTATAKRDVENEIREHFAQELNQELELFEAEVERHELSLRVERSPEAAKLERIHGLLAEALVRSAGSAVVYFSSRRGASRAAELLREQGIVVEAFHAGLEISEKRRILDAFMIGEVPVVCATNAFGMGIDKDDVRLVIHAEIPGSLENYLQEAGRAGRDRQPAECVLLFDEADVERQFKLGSMSRLTYRDLTQILRGLRALRRRGQAELVVTSAELLRDEAVTTDFSGQDPMAETRVRTAVAWLERSRFVERGLNHTRVFQGSVKVHDVSEARRRIASLATKLRLSPSEQERWLLLLERLISAEPDEGVDADELAEVAGIEAVAGRRRRTPAEIVLQTLDRMAEAGLLKAGLRLTAHLRPRGRQNASVVFETLSALQRQMLAEMRESSVDADERQWLELSLRLLNQRLVNRQQPSHPETLLGLLWSLARDDGPLEMKYRARQRYRVRLRQSWDEALEAVHQRQAVSRVILDVLLKRCAKAASGPVQVEFAMHELADAVRRDLVLGQQVADPLAMAEKALLFLHDQKILQLQNGLAVFRQAMSLRLLPEARGRRYRRSDYLPLAHHYDERTFQVHVMMRFARLGSEAIQRARQLVRDYFRLEKSDFVDRYFAGETEMLARATGQESYTRIVDSLGHPTQMRLVSAPVGRNLLVLAGPGSGKTRVVVHRAAYLLRVERVPARRLLLLCFNRNASLELRRRLFALVGDDARGVTIATYHGLAMRLTGTSFAASALDRGGPEPDFAQLIPQAVRLLTDPEALPSLPTDDLQARLVEGYSHLLVDEYQDITQPQYDLISALAGRTETERRLTILAVGDDDQNIYGWSGANVEFLRRFQEDYGAEVHYLVECYRSSPAIIAAANQLIEQNHDRMKSDRPIVADRARRQAAAAGRWTALEPATAGRVQLVEAADVARQAAAIVARLRLLRQLDPDLAWSDCAILARQRAVLEPIRALCEEAGIPVAWTIDGRRLPPLHRVRELARFLAALDPARRQPRRASDLRELARRLGGERPTPWWQLVVELIDEWRQETADAAQPVQAALEFFYDALAERGREPALGQGLRLSTVHAAKGLEFPVVFLPGNGWSLRSGQGLEEERRLYYVGMTRAKELLHLYRLAGVRHPHLAVLQGEHVQASEAAGEPPAAAVLARRYETLELRHLFLSYAGRLAPDAAAHAGLARLEAGDSLAFQARGSHIFLVDHAGRAVARLSKEGAQRWRPRLAFTETLRVIALIERRAEDSDATYRKGLRSPRWEIPIVEGVYRAASGREEEASRTTREKPST